MKKLLGILALSAIATMTWANVDLRTNIQDIYYRGSCEEAGAVTMSVNGDDFATASTADPVFIRIRLDHNAKLCQSLVGNAGYLTYDGANWNYDTDDLYMPIYLAMRLEGYKVYAGQPFAHDTILAHSETVSIVRWLEGEGELWLRVQSASTTWIYDELLAMPIAPSVTNGTVAWTFGVSARSTHTGNLPLFTDPDMLANLPGNTRYPAAFIVTPGDTDLPITTLFCVDMENSNLQAMPLQDSILAFDTISFKETNQGWGDMDFDGEVSPALDPEFSLKYSPPNGTIDKGFQVQTNFSGDDSIARGFDFECTGGIIPFEKGGPAEMRLCADIYIGQDTEISGCVSMVNEVLISTVCDDNQHGGWFNNSFVVLANLTDSDWGFMLHGTAFYDSGQDVWWDFGVDPLGSFFIDNSGDYAYSVNAIWGISSRGDCDLGYANQVFWVGNGHLGAKTLTLHAEATMWYTDAPSRVDMYVATYIRNRGFCDDDAPYDGDEQCITCPSSVIQVGEDTWYFGDFVPCLGDPVSIFFPYLPKLQDTDFWTGLALVNHGVHDFAAGGGLMGSIYEADGTNWKVTFPALPMQNMMTWLIMEGENGTGFYGASNDPLTEGQFLQPVTAGNDLVFGDTRMNMFVTGTFEAVYFQNVTGADLDGYCLIGQGTSINGSYLARNIMLPSVALQHQDMPVVIGKAAPGQEALNAKALSNSKALEKMTVR